MLDAQGLFISITFAQPHFRRPFFLSESLTWSVQYETIGETFHYFVYELIKGKRRPDEAQMSCTKPVGGCLERTMHEHMDDESFLLNIDV